MRQAFASSDTALTALPTNKVVGAASDAAEASRAPDPSATHTELLTSLISSTAVANTHKPRLRRRRASKGGGDGCTSRA